MSGPPDRRPLRHASPVAASAVALAVAGVLVAAVAVATRRTDPSPLPRAGASAPAGSPVPAPFPPSGEPTEPPAAPLRLRVTRVDRVFLGPSPPRPAVRRTMRRVVAAVRATMTRLHRLSFVQEDAWRTGRYGEALLLFDGRARAAARRDLTILTLGPDAGERFASVRAVGGRLRMEVLLGRQGGPVTAVATVVFRARAETLDGGSRLIVSEGRYFLRPVGPRWAISGYRVGRHDRAAEG